MKYIIKKHYIVLDKYYSIRKKYIESIYPKTKKELLLYENYSNIIINILYLGCKYDKKTVNMIKNTLKYKNNKDNKSNYKDKKNILNNILLCLEKI